MGVAVTPTVELPDDAIAVRFIRAGGPGGQNVNKVATAVQLRLDLPACPGLSEAVRERLATLAGRRLTDEGILVITAQRFRTQEQNRRDAFERLIDLVRRALIEPKRRKATRPTRASRERRLQSKQQHGNVKRLRRKVSESD